MDDLRTGARELAEQSLEKAYADVLENYLTYSASGECAGCICPQIYGRSGGTVCRRHTVGSWCTDTHGRIRQCGVSGFGYNTDTVKGCIKETADQGCYVPAADPKYEVDYGAGRLR